MGILAATYWQRVRLPLSRVKLNWIYLRIFLFHSISLEICIGWCNWKLGYSLFNLLSNLDFLCNLLMLRFSAKKIPAGFLSPNTFCCRLQMAQMTSPVTLAHQVWLEMERRVTMLMSVSPRSLVHKPARTPLDHSREWNKNEKTSGIHIYRSSYLHVFINIALFCNIPIYQIYVSMCRYIKKNNILYIITFFFWSNLLDKRRFS